MEKLISEFSVGLFFWQLVIFVSLILLLRKFAWKPILTAVDERESKISDALEQAEKAKAEVARLQSNNEALLREAQAERDAILKAARDAKESMISEAKSKASEEANRMIEQARESIRNEKMAAVTELKNQVATLSLEIAEKLVKEQLSSDAKQVELSNKLVSEIKLN